MDRHDALFPQHKHANESKKNPALKTTGDRYTQKVDGKNSTVGAAQAKQSWQL